MVSRSARPSSTRTRFFGRRVELEAIDAAFARGPVVTLAGPPGVGKSRLAYEWATRRDEAANVVDLSGARTNDDVVHALATTLGCDATMDAVIAAFAGTTVVLDNAEGARDHLAELLRADLAEASVLVTSRMRLGLDGESVVKIGGLAVDGDALALFLDRAQAHRPSVTRDDEGVVDVVRWLGGVPLALELAAARTLLLSPKELVARLRASSLDMLVRTVGDADSMRARYEWSLALLSPPERDALARLSVVGGPMTVAEAEAVAGSLGAVEALREHHLLRDDDDRLVLESVARELLAESTDRTTLDAAFARWLAFLGDEAERVLADETDDADGPLRRLDRAARGVFDVLLARACASEGDPARAAALFAALTRSRKTRGPIADVGTLGERLLRTVDRADPAHLRITMYLGIGLAETNTPRAHALLEDAVARAQDVRDAATERLAALHLAVIDVRMGDLASARARIEAHRRASGGSHAEQARAGHASAIVAIREGSLERAQQEIDDALVHARRSRSSAVLSRAELLAGMIAIELGRPERADAHLRAAIAACDVIDDRASASMARNFLAEVRLYQGDPHEALALFHASILAATRVGLGVAGAYALACRGLTHLAAGHLALADADLAEARALCASFDEHDDTALADAGRACIAKLRGDATNVARFVASATSAVNGTIERAGVAALLSFADGASRPGPFVNPGPRIATFVAGRLAAGAVTLGGAPTLVCFADGFAIDGQPRVDLAPRPRLLALFGALAAAHERQADAFVSRARLVEETWRGERMTESAAANRLKVALSTLRKLGLLLDSTSEGVRIAAGARVVHEFTRA